MPAKSKTGSSKKPALSKKITAQSNVLVTGDLIIDHNIYLGNRFVPGSNNPRGTNTVSSFGGSGLLFQIIKKMMETEAAQPVIYNVDFGFDIKDFSAVNGVSLENSQHSYSFWEPCKKENGSKKIVWRMTKPLGYGNLNDSSNKCTLSKITENKQGYRIIAIDDGALGFRNRNNKNLWPDFLSGKKGKGTSRKKLPDWIIYKLSSPIAQGDLFRELTGEFRDRLIVIVSINDLRTEEVGITKGLSWERTALDLLNALKVSARVRQLMRCKHLLVNFGSEGTLWINNSVSPSANKLVFDPAYLERDWDKAISGSAYGFMSCLTAGVIHELAFPKEEKIDLGKGIVAGLSAMRHLNLTGHGDIADKNSPAIPFVEIAETFTSPSTDYSTVDIHSPDAESTANDHWTIMECAHGVSKEPQPPLYGLARRVALFGPKALSDIPYSRFGKLFTVDRREIESLRGIQQLITQYEAVKRQKKPLSIAVFGPPGSGKSFGIKQIAKAVMDVSDEDILEFNLSQFTGTEELTAAFHQVRDRVLKGKTPCVFWDEFDSKEYFWLQYLLAPMQDGEFREGQLVHPIGKCVFVFAGGTSYDMENFGPFKDDKDAYKKFKLLKGPDFVSRLNGYLNVLGPNRRQILDRKDREWRPDNNPEDICFPVRRALLMRVMMGYYKNEKLDIDSGLLTALLGISEYKHGARSLETILTLTKQNASDGLRRSDLPPREQISLHVDFDKFLELVNRDLPFKMKREGIAPHIHGYYRKLGQEEGWISPELNRDFDDLDEFLKESNLAAAERMPEVLGLIGLHIQSEQESAESKGTTRRLSKREYEKILSGSGKLEMIAETEHNLWMEFYKLNGWVLDDTRNDVKKRHNLLIPYHKLSEEDKEKDRNSVRSYYPILESAGFNIVQSK